MSLFETSYKYTSTNREGFFSFCAFCKRSITDLVLKPAFATMQQEHLFRNALSWLHMNILLCLCHHSLQPSPIERYVSCFQVFLVANDWVLKSWSSYLCPWARDRDSWMGNVWSKVILHFISFFLFHTIHGVRCITFSSIHLVYRYISLSSHPDQNIEHFQHP